jgi:class 3 adenylate cyclase/tetratricopeptide (TPR) repeat protein
VTCPRCQHENPPQAKFCLECGGRLAAACASCGAELAAGSNFCNKCGTPVATEAATQPRFVSPETYTPKHLAEKILTSKAALEGERKQVTVLFADLTGSMELLADRDPEEARKLLDPVLERMIEAVHRYEGTVNQVMGDGIMALFGAPLAHEDHAVRACYAALRMQESVKQYADEVRPSDGAVVKIRVGLNSGEVVVRAIGSDLRMDYTAVGQTTHVAARMEQLAPAGTVRLTGETMRLTEGYVEVRSLGPISVKGLTNPIEVYELTGVGMARTRLQAAALRGLTRFVGRDAEVEHLRRVLGQAGASRGQVVAIVGEAGVGKSRLVYEFTHSHRVQDQLILEALSVSYGKTTSYLPVIDLLKGYFKIGDRDDHREMRDKVLGRVLGLDRALESLLPPLFALLDVPVDDPAWQSLDPPQRRQRTLDAVKRLLLRESQVQPLLVVFEDLHWIDGATQALLDSLVESVGSARLLLLVSYRPEYEHRWGSKTAYSQLRLDSLPAASAAELLAALLGPDPGLAPLTQMLVKLVKRGNPFFLEETVRTLVETGALAGQRGAYRLTRPVEALQVPATVQTILAARIDRLPPEEKQLLQAASVIGKDVPDALLAAIAEQPEETLRRGLAHLQEAEFLYETRLFPDLEYTFKHALTHEVAYGRLLAEPRRTLHGRIAEAIERLYSTRLADHVERLAHHAFEGEAWAKAHGYLHQAGTKAFTRCAHQEAAAYFDRALVALSRLPESRERIERTVDLHFDLRNTLQPLGEFGRILECLRETETLARTLGDQRRLGEASAYLTDYFRLMGDPDRAIEYGHQALAIADAVGEFTLRLRANTYLGQTYHALGEYRRAAGFLTGNIDSLDGERMLQAYGFAQLPSVHSRTCLVWCLAELGEFEDGVRIGREAIRIAESVDHPFTLATAHAGIGSLYVRQGNYEAAIPILERGLDLCRVWKLSLWFPPIASALGVGYSLSGRVADAVPLLEQAVEQSEGMRLGGWHSRVLTSLSAAYLIAGRASDALQTTRRALDVARRHKERGHEAWSWRLLGEISLRAELGIGEAEEALHRALTLATELEMRPLVAHCHLGFGTLYRRSGRRGESDEHFATATTMYREMDMTYWLGRAEAELQALS